VIECDAEIGVNHELRRQLLAHERLPQLMALGFTSRTRDADTESPRNDVTHLARRQRVAHDVRNHTRRRFSLPRAHSARRTDRLCDRASLLVRDNGVRLRSAAVNANDNEGHRAPIDAGEPAGASLAPWVSDARTPTTSVIVVPINTNHGY